MSELDSLFTRFHRKSQLVHDSAERRIVGWARAFMTYKRLRFSRAKRLSGRKAFGRVFAAGCAASNHLLVIYAARNELPHARVGLSVGRKVGAAVARHRVKRLLREAFRLEQRELPAGCDLILVPRAGTSATLADYRAALRSIAPRAAARANKAGTDTERA